LPKIRLFHATLSNYLCIILLQQQDIPFSTIKHKDLYMNKHYYAFILLPYLAISSLCKAMERELPSSKHITPTKLTDVKNPHQALYLDNQHVLISGSPECKIISLTPNQNQQTILQKNIQSSCISVHPNKKIFALATCSPPYFMHEITFYNSQTNNPEHTIKCNSSILKSLEFSPFNDIVAISLNKHDHVTIYNYKKSTHYAINFKKEDNEVHSYRHPKSPLVSFHPTQPLMCLALNNLYVHNLQSATTTVIPNSLLQENNFCEYSPNGFFIVRGTKYKIVVTYPDSNTHKILITEKNKNNSFNKIAIHPNNKILLTLSQPNGTLRCWNIESNELLSEMNILPNDNNDESPFSSLSLSPNGIELLLILREKCITIPMPFAALFKGISKDNSIFAYLALQHLTNNSTLPKEIIAHLIKNILVTSQY